MTFGRIICLPSGTFTFSLLFVFPLLSLSSFFLSLQPGDLSVDGEKGMKFTTGGRAGGALGLQPASPLRTSLPPLGWGPTSSRWRGLLRLPPGTLCFFIFNPKQITCFVCLFGGRLGGVKIEGGLFERAFGDGSWVKNIYYGIKNIIKIWNVFKKIYNKVLFYLFFHCKYFHIRSILLLNWNILR